MMLLPKLQIKSRSRGMGGSWQRGIGGLVGTASAPTYIFVTESSLGSNPDIPQKSYMGDLSKTVANTF
jgi:hypothetical protein